MDTVKYMVGLLYLDLHARPIQTFQVSLYIFKRAKFLHLN